jgi:hypothetical protein
VDLLGVNPEATASSWGLPRVKALYGSLPEQLQQPHSFASELKTILEARKRCGIALGDLVAIPEVAHPGVCVLVCRLPSGEAAITALNFSRTAVRETIDLPAQATPRGTSGLKLANVITRAEEGTEPSGKVRLALDGLSGKTLVVESSGSETGR